MPRALRRAFAPRPHPCDRKPEVEAATGLLTPTPQTAAASKPNVAQSVVNVAIRLVAVWPYASTQPPASSGANFDPLCAALRTAIAQEPAKKLGFASTYVAELLKRSRSPYAALQLALLFMIRARVSNRLEQRLLCCGRRALLAALMLAGKVLNDRSVRTAAWARISGLACAELNASELEFLKALDWSLDISPQQYSTWCACVLQVAGEPAPLCLSGLTTASSSQPVACVYASASPAASP